MGFGQTFKGGGLLSLAHKASEETREGACSKGQTRLHKSNLPHLDSSPDVYFPVFFNRETIIQV